MLNNLAALKNCKNLSEVHESPYFQKHFVEKYINDLPRLAFEVFGKKLTWQQIEIIEKHDWIGGRLAVPSGHGIGKTLFIGFLATAHLLLFQKSITRIQAPKEDQVTKFAFKEIKAMLGSLEAPRKVNNRLIRSEWHFLFNLIQQNTTLIYAKGFKESWYIEPATAPKGDPTNLSGQHNWSYLLLFDECSGIPDTHIDGSLGALSEKFNSCIAFSQHTRTSGRFHEFVTTSSVDQGGVWKVARMNSEQSPRVTAEAIRAWRATYTENEYNVRVLGLPPLFEDGFLLNTLEAQRAYSKKGKDWIDTLQFDTITFSTDVAYTGLRDSSVYTELRVSVVTDVTGKQKLYCIVDDINVFQGKTAKLPTDLSKAVFDALLRRLDEDRENNIEYLFKRLPIDATAGGHEAYTKLDEHIQGAELDDALVQGVTWGSGRLVGFDKKRFLNQRAKANVMLKEAVSENRFYIATNKYKTRVLNELSHIPFTFTVDFRYKILSKQDMAKLGIRSPDIIDTFSQQFLVPYVQTGNSDSPATEEDTDEVIEEDISEEIIDLDDDPLTGIKDDEDFEDLDAEINKLIM
ncbi:hypothetical protein [Sulfurovum sp.]|uniref:hypothetical protein n=1 Tax=Sulfurovum sp. TaxID=1969726 RepID=UPI0025F098AC|nr:hypothetical protein [Sulfurovum sp.]